MSEERLLVLNMLRDGKLSPEQADSLLRAMRDPDVRPASAPPPPPADPSTLASVQSRLADLQNKIGEIQGKQVADRAARIAGHAASFAGKVIGQMPRPEIDFRKALDETLAGLNGLKDDAIKTARQAAQEAKRLAKEGKEAVANGAGGVTLSEAFAPASQRPAPESGQESASETFETSNSFVGTAVVVVNRYGDVKVLTGAEERVEITGEKIAWAATDAEARVLLQQVFVTNRLENGIYKIDLVAPVDGRDRVTVDLTITVPPGVACEIETTFGDIDVAGTSPALTARSNSGDITARDASSGSGETRTATRSGTVHISGWKTSSGSITAQTVSGDIIATNLGSTGDVMLHSQSGDISGTGVETASGLTVESISGDIQINGGSAATQATVKSQSGNVHVMATRAPQLTVESVSGDANISDVGGTLTLKSVSGDIQAVQINSHSVALTTVSGDASFDFAAPHTGSFAGTSVSGDISLALWSTSDARINAASTSGDIHSSFDGSLAEMSGMKNFSGTLGNGAGSIRLQSVSGDLNIVDHK